MQRERPGGLLLIIAPVLTVLIMVMHPTGQDLAENFEHGALVNRLVHGTALLAVPLIFMGLLALSRRLDHPDSAVAGLVAYGVAVVAWMLAGVASGFVQTELFGEMRESGGAEAEMLHVLSHFTFAYNQAFAAVGVLASSMAIGLLSLAILHTRRLPVPLAWFGMIAAVGLLLAQSSGHLVLDIHGFGLVVLVQTVWLVWSGVNLLRPEPPRSGP